MRVLSVVDPPFDRVPAVGEAGRPAHAWIQGWLEERIVGGDLLVGDRLPPESDLAPHFGVSRMTLRQALAALEEKLLIQRRRGRSGGTFVREPRIEHDLTGLPGFTEQLRRAAIRPGGVVVSAELVDPPDEVGQTLGLEPGERTFRVRKIRLANGEPVALEDTWVPAAIFPGLLDHDLTGSLYALMSNHYGQTPASALEEVEPATADDTVAELLEVEEGTLLLRIIRITETPEGARIEFARDLFRADRTRLTMHSRISAALARGAISPTA